MVLHWSRTSLIVPHVSRDRLNEIAKERRTTLNSLVQEMDRNDGSRTSLPPFGARILNLYYRVHIPQHGD